MVVLWALETIPAAGTAALPLLLLPMLGVLSDEEASQVFLSPRFLWLLFPVLLNEAVQSAGLLSVVGPRLLQFCGYDLRSLAVAMVSYDRGKMLSAAENER